MIKHFYIGEVPPENRLCTCIPANLIDIMDLRYYGVTQITGLTRPEATINRSPLAGANASYYNSSQITERNIVIGLVPQGRGEATRQMLYDIFPFDTPFRCYIVTDSRAVYIDGYAETIDGDDDGADLFDVQVSIICPFPWFQSIELYAIKPVKHQDIPLQYTGDIPAGFSLYIPHVSGSPVAVSSLYINIPTRGSMSYRGEIVSPALCTIPSKKSFTGRVWSTDHTEGEYITVDMLSRLTAPIRWMTITKNNVLTMSWDSATTADGKDLFEEHARVYYRDTYSGV